VSGSIITFYSYKGGVGRTLALVNQAVLLARWGYRVLCVDWDLEAPGTHHYFARHLSSIAAGGTLDLIERLAAGGSGWEDLRTTVDIGESGVTLDLLTAGQRGEDYVPRVQGLKWAEMYTKNNLGLAIEELRAAWTSSYDFVLVDSRTGITDIGGVCTVQLPDILVLVTTPSHQGTEGTLDIMARSAAARQSLPYDRASVPSVPVISRFDGRVERELAMQWMDLLAERFAPIFEPWIDPGVSPRRLVELLRVPHVARYSFGEELPVLEERTSDPDSMGYAYETIAAFLANRLADSAFLANNRDSYVNQAGKDASRARPATYDVFIGHTKEDEKEAVMLARTLHRKGLRVLKDIDSAARTDDMVERLQAAFAESACFVFLIGHRAEKSNWIRWQVDHALRVFAHSGGLLRIMPVVIGPTFDVLQAFPALASIRALRLVDGNYESIADEIVASLGAPVWDGGRVEFTLPAREKEHS
jgi:cellulose biosynthesis protein BcsQ